MQNKQVNDPGNGIEFWHYTLFTSNKKASLDFKYLVIYTRVNIVMCKIYIFYQKKHNLASVAALNVVREVIRVGNPTSSDESCQSYYTVCTLTNIPYVDVNLRHSSSILKLLLNYVFHGFEKKLQCELFIYILVPMSFKSQRNVHVSSKITIIAAVSW